MIKTSGYRVSPTEVEAAVYAVEIIAEAIAIGVPHPDLGQGIVVVAVKTHDHHGDDKMNTEMILSECRGRLPNYMVPGHVEWRTSLPRNPNGKIDRKQIQDDLRDVFGETAS